MWSNLDMMERIRAAQLAAIETREMREKRETEQEIDEAGRGICLFCDNEVYRNNDVPGGGWLWESEGLLGFCDKGVGRKHQPGSLATWSPDTKEAHS